ncbi:MAG: AsmA-like C-terminal region-containing protein [Elusimicrobiaceae bacterium]|nr:AsmA-like C-terminal region-containing protein [Elusimicrobiaceae bacterium]
MNSVSSELKSVKQIRPLKPLKRHGRVMLSTRWILRGAVLLALLVSLAVAVGAYIVQTMFTPQHITMLISYKLQEALHRPVVVENARLLVFKGLKVGSIRVLGKREDLVSTGPLEISYRWMPLLRRQLEVDDAVIEDIRVNAVVDSSGAWRLGDLPHGDYGSGNRSGRNSAATLLRMISSANVSVRNAVLAVRDPAGGEKRVYSLPELHLWDFSVDKNTPFRLAFEYDGGSGPRPVHAGVYAEGFFNLAGLNLSSATLSDTDVRVNAFRGPAYLKLDAENFLEPVVTLSAALPALSDKDLYPFTGKPFGLNLPKSKVTGTARYAGGRLDLSDLNISLGGMALRARGSVAFSTAMPAYNVEFRSNSIDLGSLSKYWGGAKEYLLGGKVSMTLTVSERAGQPAVEALRLYSKNAKGIFLGFMVSKADFSAVMDGANSALKINNATVKVGDTVFSSLKGSATYDGSTLTVGDLSGRYNDSRFRLKTEIANLKDVKKRDIHSVVRMNHIDVGETIGTIRSIAHGVSSRPAPKPFEGKLAWLRNFRRRMPDFMPRFHGSIYAEKLVTPVISGRNLKIEFNLRGIGRGMRGLHGKVYAKLDEGVVYQLERMAEQSPALNVAFRPFLAMHRMETSGAFQIGSVLRDVGFNSMAASTNWRYGGMWINSFYLDGGVMSAYMDGMVDWPGEKLDLNVYTRFTARRGMGGLSENLTDSSGNPALSFNIKNSMLAPKVTMRSPDDVGRKISAAAAAGISAEFKEIQQYLNMEKPKREAAAASGRKNVGTK